MKYFLTISFMLLCSNVHSHSGGTDSYGCHTNHSTGGYHCHNPKSFKESASAKGRQPASANIKSKISKKKSNLKFKKVESK